MYFRNSFVHSLFASSIPAEIEGGDVSGLPFEVPAREVVSLTLRPSQTYGWQVTTGAFASQPTTPEIGMELRNGRALRQSGRAAVSKYRH